jgi:hypothetical protein
MPLSPEVLARIEEKKQAALATKRKRQREAEEEEAGGRKEVISTSTHVPTSSHPSSSTLSYKADTQELDGSSLVCLQFISSYGDGEEEEEEEEEQKRQCGQSIDKVLSHTSI